MIITIESKFKPNNKTDINTELLKNNLWPITKKWNWKIFQAKGVTENIENRKSSKKKEVFF